MENLVNETLDNKITIVDDNGVERICEVLFTYENPDTGKKYVVFYPVEQLDDDNVEEMDLFAYSFIEHEDGRGELFALESDEEYDMINEVIDQYYADQLEEEEE